jgi:dihydrofolate synthase/folylpolyglutamate synthase
MRQAVADLDRAGTGDSDSRPTFFEITTAMAFRHFARQQLDVAVLEVGMGGRLDSTNVCEPAVCVITTISFDHTRQLGNTLAAIAGEKAGIIKPGVPVVSGVVTPEPEAVIAKTAAERGSPLFQLGRDFLYEYHAPEGPRPYAAGTFDYREPHSANASHLREIQLGLLGAHQAANASVSVAALQRLRDDGWRVPEEAIRAGIAHAQCPARIEVLQREPTVVVDTAHNVASIEALLQTIDESFPQKQRLLVFSASRDKDWQGMLEILVPRFQHIVLTRYINNPRSVPPDVLENFVGQLAEKQPRDGNKKTTSVVACSCPDDAWREVQRTATPQHFVCITGSFFLAAEMRSRAECEDWTH